MRAPVRGIGDNEPGGLLKADRTTPPQKSLLAFHPRWMGGQAIKAWAKEHEPQPPLPIATRIKQGVIVGIYDYDPASYRVKEDGCTNDSRSLLIKFEDAAAACPSGAARQRLNACHRGRVARP